MMRLLAALVVCTAATASLASQAAPALPRSNGQVIAHGLETVWSLAFAPDGRLFVTERPGRIRVINKDVLAPEPWATIPRRESAPAGIESGLMGLAIDPQFDRNHRVYVCYTHPGPPLVNRIGVLTDEKGKGTRLTVLLDGLFAGMYHNGCRLECEPDGRLYARIGEGNERPLAQLLDKLAGKVLRLNPDGSVPADNPF